MAPGEFGIGGVRIPNMKHAQVEDTPPSDNVRDLVLKERKARMTIEERLDQFGLDVSELKRVVADFKAHLEASKRWAWLKSLASSTAFATILAALVAGAFQLWGVKLQTKQEPAKADYAAEQQRAKDLETVRAGISADLQSLRVEIEQSRRGYPQPMRQDAEKVAPKR
jgi:hypothetical protein